MEIHRDTNVDTTPITYEYTVSTRADFLSGVRVSLPILLGIVPFGMVAGVAAVSVGIPAIHALAMSVFIFAGASQLAATELIGRDAPIAVVILTVLVVNLRMMMYSASLAPYFEHESARWKAALAYPLTDQAYAVSLLKFRNDEKVHKRWYYLGVALTLWTAWQISTIVGILLGASIPESWHLGFTVPLVFLAVLIPAITDRPTLVAAIVGGVAAVAANGLPFDIGLVVGALVGIGAGLLTEEVA